jgi:hypothetical protein
MMMPREPTAEWLSEILRQAGVLRQGAVTHIEQQASGVFNSQSSNSQSICSANQG